LRVLAYHPVVLAVVLAAQPRSLDVFSLVMDSGPMAQLVLFILLGFSVRSWAIMAERYRAFARAERESDTFLERFKKGGGLAGIQDASSGLTASPIANLFRAAFREISLNPPPPEGPDAATIDALDRVLKKHASVEVIELERSLGFLATTAGLAAAIPALIGYNHFTRKLRLFEAGMDEFSADLVHRVLGRRS